jgi:predicted RNase H-like HicB family nuclease
METIPVVYHADPDGWWADSPAVQGWTATAKTLEELRALVEEGVRFALSREDVVVEHVLAHGVPA